MRIAGKTFSQIARELGMTNSNAQRSFRRVREEWLQSRVNNYDLAVAEELARLDDVIAKANEGWERSLRDAEKRVTESDEKGGVSERIEKAGQAGDPRFLQVILSALQQRQRILGLLTPEIVNVNIPPQIVEVVVTSREDVMTATQFMESVVGGKTMNGNGNGNGHAIATAI